MGTCYCSSHCMVMLPTHAPTCRPCVHTRAWCASMVMGLSGLVAYPSQPVARMRPAVYVPFMSVYVPFMSRLCSVLPRRVLPASACIVCVSHSINAFLNVLFITRAPWFGMHVPLACYGGVASESYPVAGEPFTAMRAMGGKNTQWRAVTAL
jgi:hypothetical protein